MSAGLVWSNEFTPPPSLHKGVLKLKDVDYQV